MNKSKRLDFWEKRASEMKADDDTTLKDMYQGKIENTWILENIIQGENVLDIGCGNGSLCIKLSNYFKSVIGIDFSVTMIDKAEDLNKKMRKNNVKFYKADARNLPFESNYFDCVITKRALINLKDWNEQQTALDEIYRVLKQGGIYLMLESCIDGYNNINSLREKNNLGRIIVAWRNSPFKVKDLNDYLSIKFLFIDEFYLGIYYLLSRVFHPMFVAPKKSEYESKINELSYELTKRMDFKSLKEISPVFLYILQKNE